MTEKIFSISQASRDLGAPVSRINRTMKLLGIPPITFGSASLKGVTESDVARLRLVLVGEGLEVES